MITLFLENCYSIGFNLKNARNGKSTLKVPKWPSLRPLELKSLYDSLNFRKILRIFRENVAREQDLALQQLFSSIQILQIHTNLTNLLIQTVINSHFAMTRASNLAILIFST